MDGILINVCLQLLLFLLFLFDDHQTSLFPTIITVVKVVVPGPEKISWRCDLSVDPIAPKCSRNLLPSQICLTRLP